MGEQAYQRLMDRVRDTAVVQSIGWLLSWDQETNMPAAGASHRGRQLALVAGLVHERLTASVTKDLLAEVEAAPWLQDAPPHARANVAETRRVHERLTRVPRTLVEEVARTVPVAQHAWASARRASDFALFRPHLEKMVALKRDEARAIAGSGGDPYDALMDEFEPGARIAEVAPFLDALVDGLAPAVLAISKQGNPPLPWEGRRFPVERQRVVCGALPAAIGLSPQGSRLDVSAHPFCQRIGVGDLRITTRYDEADPRGAYFGVLHEAGHALYEQGLDPAHDGTPCGEARSLAVHESQSRLWENLVGRGRPWWRHHYPTLRAVFPEALHDVELEAFYRAINRVAPSFIRVEADEVTYNLHIAVRVRLERAIITGALAVADLPGAWNDEYRRALGLTPPDDARGCLQDVHWSCGAFGYFATYALGNVYGAQLMEAARAALPSLDDEIASGSTASLLAWLVSKVHRRGASARGARIVEDATGYAPDAAAFLRYIKQKYGPLYGF
ncbi:MAG: carboxypeptidase M32 [Deltaproteobacteria bacterium]|nr:carboxypeptidase M32 [Deltaproteobacteria bacterium]